MAGPTIRPGIEVDVVKDRFQAPIRDGGAFRYPLARLSLRLADFGKSLALRNYRLFLASAGAPFGYLEGLSAHAALRAAQQAHRRVPAYRDLVERSGWRDDPRLPPHERVRLLPPTDKESYVKAFSTEARCLDGRIPMARTEIDESSGSSGVPFNWVRGGRELQALHREMSQFARYLCGTEVITINGFSMGAWATGVNVGEALRANGMVKSTGPDVDKILHTLRFFGPGYTYIVTGYPPFLKHLLDEGTRRGFDWTAYRLFGIVGGEGMNERLREHLEEHFKAVYSAYGASDLDMGVAGELPLGVWIRKQAAADRGLQTALFGDDPRLPMLFQYNPLDYYIEADQNRELIVTINRLTVLSPRIRYNIHDLGGTVSFEEMLNRLGAHGLDPLAACRQPGRPVFRLPFLYLFGRSDQTISYMGANIYPEDVEQALLAVPEDADRLGDYCLELVDTGSREQRPCVHVEVTGGAVEDPMLADRLRERVLSRLLANSLDFRSAVSEDESAGELLVRLHSPRKGPFAANAQRIKRRYLVPPPSPAS